MYKIAICDDDKRYRETIRKSIQNENMLPSNEICFYEYGSGKELLENIMIQYELVFIDIRMPGINGNETALEFRKRNNDAILIFCSNYFAPTPESINIGQPFRYVMKDLHDKSLRCEMPAIISELKRRFSTERIVTATSAGGLIWLNIEEILYVCLAKRGCQIHLLRANNIEEIHCKESLRELYVKLEAHGFAYAHNSYIVNLGNVEGFEKNILTLQGGIQLNISRSKKNQFTDALLNYLHERSRLI